MHWAGRANIQMTLPVIGDSFSAPLFHLLFTTKTRMTRNLFFSLRAFPISCFCLIFGKFFYGFSLFRDFFVFSSSFRTRFRLRGIFYVEPGKGDTDIKIKNQILNIKN